MHFSRVFHDTQSWQHWYFCRTYCLSLKSEIVTSRKNLMQCTFDQLKFASELDLIDQHCQKCLRQKLECLHCVAGTTHFEVLFFNFEEVKIFDDNKIRGQ